MTKPFSLLVKPASADCNLRCDYCFYLDKRGLYPESAVHRMSDDVLEGIVSRYMATDQPAYAFGWQGGEPTVMGVEFFRRVTTLQQKYGKPGSVVSNGLQTNATLIDDEFARHLYEYKFLVGVSLDGPAEIHDFYRKHVNGSSSHSEVLEGIGCLQRNRVEFNTLTLVNSANVMRGREVYRYLRDIGLVFHQYIPCVEFGSDGSPLPWCISGEQWGEFLCGVFDEWYVSDTPQVSVRLFDSILGYMLDGKRNICHMDNNCCQYFLVEYNGDIYPCDFYAEPGLRLGNMSVDVWDSVQQSDKYRQFGAQKLQWNQQCVGCEFVKYCMGDCLKHRVPGCGDLSHLCAGWQRFFEHSLPGFEKLVGQIRRERTQIDPGVRVGRNDPCPCGSGKKFKKCHGV